MRYRFPVIAALVVATCGFVGFEPVARADASDADASRGALVIAGGGAMPRAIINEFVALAGGSDARLVIIPTAASDDALTKADASAAMFKRFGVEAITILHTRSRRKANTAAFVEPLTTATAVWIGGGAQIRLSRAYRKTRVERALIALVRRGGVVGGASAGAAIMTKVMIRSGQERPNMAKGFDLLPRAIVDQHFDARNREKRLRRALRKHRKLLGVGVDEATAVIVQGERARVIGDGMVSIFPPKRRGERDLITLKAGDRATLDELRLGTWTRPSPR